jgi:hypothetical protein
MCDYMDLKKIVEDHWDKGGFMSLALKKELREAIEKETIFLDEYYDHIQLRSRAYCIKNGITKENLPQCKANCGKPAGLNYGNSVEGFRLYCGPECHKRDFKISDVAKNKLGDYNWVYNQRVILKKGYERLGKELGVSEPTVVRWIEKHGLKDAVKNVRAISEETKATLKDKNKMYDLYVTQKLTYRQIAKILSSNVVYVREALIKHGIRIRSSNEHVTNRKFTSKGEKKLSSYVKKITDCNVIENDRFLLRGKELDIYVPSKNIAFEYNGLYTHCYKPNEKKPCLIKGPEYHLIKTEKALENGVQLIQFFSSEWDYNNLICKSLVKRKLLKNRQIHSKECQVKVIDKKLANEFLVRNSIFGSLEDNFISVGLYDKRSLIHLLCFKLIDNKWFVVRNESRMGVSVIGGFKTCLDEFRKFNSGDLYCDIDRRFSDGKLLKSYGFVVASVIDPSYYYTNRRYLFLFNRDVIEEECDGNEHECFYCENPKYKKLFDCGYLRLKLQ